MDTIQQQTLQIVLCLFQEDLGCIEVDGVGDGMIQLYTQLDRPITIIYRWVCVCN